MAATAVAAGTGSPAGTESAEGGPGAAAALELWLNKATDPSMAEQDWSAIQKFCEQVNTDPSGPTHAPWLLAHKIQSPQEKEALYALTVLEICMNHCGEKFHSEVAKFRFLNELIKVLSPKYLGAWATEKVKGRVIEILFSWTVWFPEDIKIRDAYQMLKKQGIIKQDPKLPMDKILPPPSPWPKSIFDADEEKSKLLTRLLKSNHPEDLQAANRLIKNLVKEEQEKSEKVSRRVSAVEEVRSHVRVLREMLSMYRRPGHALPDQQALQVVYERCEKLRPTLFRLASDTTDDDDALAEILQANDLLTQGVRLYKQVVEGRVSAGNAVPAAVGAIPAPRAFPNPEPCGLNCPLIDLETPSLLHQDLAALGINDVPTRNQVVIPSCCNDKKQPGAITLMGGGIQSLSADRNLLDLFSPQPSPGLNYVPQKSIPKEVPPGTKASPGWSWEAGPLASSTASQNTPLAHVFVPLESVKPSSLPPIVVYDRNGFRILLHFSQTGAPGHPDVKVLLLTMMSTATQPVWDVMFQVAVPKSMRVKLQPASSSKLPAFSPLMPPAVISQTLLLDNPHKEPIRLRYKLTFNQGGQPFSEVGEVKDFPDLAVLSTA
ncbi:ADP-ribosylation factor-binding protein GGA2 [Mus musculus]|uniref:ADP-ribosylation factor-binding protein GGA2 n=3 Tax=Mus TaxID=862507 RepID=GGA2_MOUSE|nr:ADP-ribosylation factor-binding protein GGA2 [Mus musculus]XP_021023116.1 ADP-ribosylation factor-binding protein GGA2 [Mus caroli]Q6P5E6.1 RecName: Full=ADP-ribosylation factor-binding protein GGA2; AltName: Full=Gamma-adaptin-related protein 2; AltName: Full=Golgi-localized, gamma ear-containing, ARF-binding protein 2 [Mus musculus]AAH62933.1 Gga2 protein [Mus musculus]EDL17258.1 golgi associated, gamma adaptin ear containing, ARF binding protein 2, isoform CRA_c [Mus musculus]BAE25501.1 |eukprot:NP_083034.1 ADP-ribosylation factor-binding protein GGA2 [Mus musculus]